MKNIYKKSTMLILSILLLLSMPQTVVAEDEINPADVLVPEGRAWMNTWSTGARHWAAPGHATLVYAQPLYKWLMTNESTIIHESDWCGTGMFRALIPVTGEDPFPNGTVDPDAARAHIQWILDNNTLPIGDWILTSTTAGYETLLPYPPDRFIGGHTREEKPDQRLRDFGVFKYYVNGKRDTGLQYSVHHAMIRKYPDGTSKIVESWGFHKGRYDTYVTMVEVELDVSDIPMSGDPMVTYEMKATGNIVWRKDNPQINHYSPLVNGEQPNPHMDNAQNNIGYILQDISDRINIGDSVSGWVSDQEITGSYTGEVLVKNEQSILKQYEYKATCDFSGAQSIVDSNGEVIGIGSGTIKYTITDYEDDVTIYTRPIITKSTGATDVSIWLNYDNSPYTGQWMSNDDSADIARKSGLDIQANSDINGNYDLATLIDFDESGNKVIKSSTAVDRASTATGDVTNDMIIAWKNKDSLNNNQNTSINGAPVTSIANKKDDPTTPLSAESTPQYIYYDSTKPTLTVVDTDDDWATITTNAADSLSGLYENKGVYFKFVPKDTTTGIATPMDGSDWIPLSDYTTTFADLGSGEYDLYVYAKDNATNRSDAVKVTLTVEGGATPKTALVCLKKEVTGTVGANDIFLISMKEGSVLLTSVALKSGDESGAIELDMEGITSKDIDINEIIPMDYDSGFTVSIINNKDKSETPVGGNTVNIQPGDDITIVVENTFAPTGFFKGKDFVRNLFK